MTPLMKEKIKEELTDGLLRELGDRWNNARIRCTRSVEGVEGETEVQLTAFGPWQLYYVNPADDPSRSAAGN